MSTLFVARRTLLAIVAMSIGWTSQLGRAEAATGAKNFNDVCGACHTIGGGKRVGPDLKGVNERRSEEWLLKFIKSSQTVVKSGDPTATALFNENAKIVMPDVTLSPAEIKEILAYIKSGGAAAPAAPTLRAGTPEDLRKGQELFQGTIAFANGGPACNSCHNVQNDAVIGGGVLAKDLTSVFGRMGAPGVQAILGKAPFPVMDEAFKDRPLTEDEIVAMVTFLQDADAKQQLQQPRDYGFKLFYSGVGGLAAIMALYGVLWRRRKKHPVNHHVFARQVRTR